MTISIRDLLAKKRAGGELDAEELAFLVAGSVSGSVTRAQLASFITTVYSSGMSEREVAALTDSMAHSGTRLSWDGCDRPLVDKHSTGGVGDGVTLVLVPLAAHLGLAVPTMAGRSLGFTGGTIDKIESIPGFTTARTPAEIDAQVRAIGCAITCQTPTLAPADSIWYALRDEIDAVASNGLIVSSILSKKIAEGISGLVLDVKTGHGGFFPTYDEARTFAELFRKTAAAARLATALFITRMDQPLGAVVGSAAEVAQAIELLKGKRNPLTEDLRYLAIEMTAAMLVMGGRTGSFSAARARAQEALDSGAALGTFQKLIAYQKGDARVVDDAALLPRAGSVLTLCAESAGSVAGVHARLIAQAYGHIGGLRHTSTDQIDPSAAIELLKKSGDRVELDEPIARIHHNRRAEDPEVAQAAARVREAFSIRQARVPESILILDILSDERFEQ